MHVRFSRALPHNRDIFSHYPCRLIAHAVCGHTVQKDFYPFTVSKKEPKQMLLKHHS